ncbi:alpha/beta fold hydrolase [Amycolatopsis pigmentata]|uniref:Alpha/beta fold hydrolase n=1 Tax=Amycolatopsis pigmentata TaxID=450801 RepID=A0ABW5FVT3_9PSEU
MNTVRTPDGRRLDIFTEGPEQAPALLFHHGTPGAADYYAPLVAAANAAGFRWISYTRPGNGDSDRAAGRTVADAAADSAAVLDALGAESFVTAGLSGGGPHALACAALLYGRCAGAVTVGGLAPRTEFAAAGLDWTDGMDQTNIGQFAAALSGENALREFIEPFAGQIAKLDGTGVIGMLGGLVDAPDRAVLTGGYADYVAACFRESARVGADGWVDDILAFTRPWGFALADIRCPVAVWQGSEDRMVAPAHGAFLAEHLPNVRPHLMRGEGHLSLGVGSFDEILAEAKAFLD